MIETSGVSTHTSTRSPIRRRTVLSAGTARAPEFAVVAGGGMRNLWLPILFAVIEHEREGIGLFDTGYAHRFFAATSAWPYRLYRWVTRVRIAPEQDAVRQLAALGIAAADVRWIVVSHFDPDHIAGLRDFPAARVLCAESAYGAIAGKQGVAALRVRLLPALLPDDLDRRLERLPQFQGPPIGPFTASHDLFNDGSIRLVDLPGHATGQIGAFVRRAGEDDLFLAADACWSRTTVSPYNHGRPRLHVHRMIAMDRASQDQTYARLRQLRSESPQIVVIPSHCREAAAILVSDQEWGEHS